MENKFLNSGEVAERMGVAPATVWQWCRRGLLPHWRFNKTLRFDAKEVDAFIKEARMGLAGREESDKDGAKGIAKSA